MTTSLAPGAEELSTVKLSAMPTPSAPAKVRGSDTSPPTRVATSAFASSRVNVAALIGLSGASSTPALPASRAPSAQLNRATWVMLTPMRRDVSWLEATARMAVPKRVDFRNQPSPAADTAARARVALCWWLMRRSPTVIAPWGRRNGALVGWKP